MAPWVTSLVQDPLGACVITKKEKKNNNNKNDKRILKSLIIEGASW